MLRSERLVRTATGAPWLSLHHPGGTQCDVWPAIYAEIAQVAADRGGAAILARGSGFSDIGLIGPIPFELDTEFCQYSDTFRLQAVANATYHVQRKLSEGGNRSTHSRLKRIIQPITA